MSVPTGRIKGMSEDETGWVPDPIYEEEATWTAHSREWWLQHGSAFTDVDQVIYHADGTVEIHHGRSRETEPRP